jgi:8-oxo-dGTP pyrophosphatase MutT (NUDIX family)
MELLFEINDQKLGMNNPEIDHYKIKKSARAVLFNDQNQVAIMYVSKDNYHKLPGGSFEKEDNNELNIALKREILEETGFVISTINQEVGMILEFRNDKN